MPALKRNKTKYPGVHYIETENKKRVYYIRYRKDEKLIEEKTTVRTSAQANQIRTKRTTGDPSNKERRAIKAERKKWTIERLKDEYFSSRSDDKYLYDDRLRYETHLKESFGSKLVGEITLVELDRFKIKLLKKLKPASVQHILGLLRRIVNFGVKRNLCEMLGFKIEMPKFDNKKTEYLTHEQVSALVHAVNRDDDPQARGLIMMALYTGLRRGALLKLKWNDVDYERDLIHLREPKGGKDGEVDVIPLNSIVRKVLKTHPRNGSPFVFPGIDGGQRVEIKRAWNRIKKRAKLPDNFRFHGLRHAYASLLASSGKVDIYMLQKLLTHRTPEMTQRYAHLLDSALQEAAETAAEIINKAASIPISQEPS